MDKVVTEAELSQWSSRRSGEVTGEHAWDSEVENGQGTEGTLRSCASVVDTWHTLKPGQVEKGDRVDVTTVWHTDIRERCGRFVGKGREDELACR